MTVNSFLTLLLFLLLPYCAVVSSSPPISDIVSNNLALASSLNYYDSNNSQSNIIAFSLGATPKILGSSLSAEIAQPTVLIDNSSYYLPSLSIIVADGYQTDHLSSVQGYGPFTCDITWQQHPAAACDLDGDTCVEYETNIYRTYDLQASFMLGNVTGNSISTSNVISIPDSVLAAISGASGVDDLNVSISGTISIIHEINDRQFAGASCSDHLVNFTTPFSISLSKNFTVGGTNKIFFLKSPVLREQWASDNRFDVFVLSQLPLDYAGLDMDGVQVKNATLRNFTVLTNHYGLEDVNSSIINSSWWSESKANKTNIHSQAPLSQANYSYAYVYEFQYGYSGNGYHVLNLSVIDVLGGASSFVDVIASRELSYDGSMKENGKPVAPGDLVRPSAQFNNDTLAPITISLGLVAFVILLAFMNYWLVQKN